jgi:TRAP-type C4-dicarboxylate transport system substrate-binding protein
MSQRALRAVRVPALILALGLAAGAGWSAPVQIKLGSLVPIGSSWDLALKKIAAEWSRLSDNQVRVIIYSGGTVGDEPSMIRKLKLGQLQAAGLTVRGLNQIDNSVLALALPMLVRDDQELDYVMSQMQPELEAGIEENGYKVIFWTMLGWVYFYGKQPVITPDDLRRQRMWVWEGDPEEASVWKDLNFRIVPLQSTDILTSLQSGMIDSFASSPLTAAAYQWFALAPHMSEMRWAPLFGGLVVANRTWERIDEGVRPRLLAAARQIGDELRADSLRADTEAIAVMQKYGLTLHPVPAAAVAQWAELMDQGFSRLAGKSFDAAAAVKVKRLVDEYRSRNGG